MLIENIQIQNWLSRFLTHKTKLAGITAYNSLNRYCKTNNQTIESWIDSMAINQDEKYNKVQEFLKSLHTMPATTRQYYALIKSYLRIVHGIKFDIQDTKDLIKLEKVISITKEPLTHEILKNLINNSTRYYQALFLIQSSSGMRISESLQLKPEHFQLDEIPVKISIPGKFTKTKKEHITFISKEAVEYLKKSIDYFEPRSLNTVELYFYRLRQKLGYLTKYEDTPNYHLNIHSMRAFFRTQAGKINQDFAEKLIGHEGYLSQYIRLNSNDLASDYLKLEPKLKIF